MPAMLAGARAVTLGHQSQYQPGASFITRTAGCTWTTGANGISAVTAGRHNPTPDELHDLLRREEETAPTTPGWSIPDLVKACGRYGVGLVEHTGEGWSALIAALDSDHYVVLQGDSDQFGNATCSGAFNGDHCIGINPRRKVEAGIAYRWIDDPICPTGRWEREAVVRRYATKLWASIRFAVFTQRVPESAGWSWQVKPVSPRKRVSFATVPVTNGHVSGTPVRHSTTGSARYHCSPPRKYPWAGHRDIPLVRLGKRVDGKPGPLEGQYVHARNAKES